MNDFPSIFREFCDRNEIDLNIYKTPQRQYFYSEASISEIEEDSVGREGGAVSCKELKHFYQISLDKHFQFSSSKLYQLGKLLPMDLSSGMAVNLLCLKSTDHVLDLCCAPGGKLILASLIQGQSAGRDFINSPELIGAVTGVDLSSHRLATCRSLMKKYKIECGRLFCSDGTVFCEPIKRFKRFSAVISDHETHKKSINETHTRPFHETSAFRKRPTELIEAQYDKVLVDAQCTHDGSIKHIRKHAENDWKGFDLAQFEESNLNTLYDLQLSLLENGFKLLKPGGILVYSTCSLSPCQNEEIIQKFMQKNYEKASPLPFEGSDSLGQMRLGPPSFDSGFFICRIRRRVVL